MYEDELISQFRQHEFYRAFPKLPKTQFRAYLLQIGLISQEFVRWYETAKLGIQSEEAKEVIRQILRDEIPRKGPTHQDDRLFDLSLIGISAKQIRNVVASYETRRAIEHLYKLVGYPQKDYDLRVMVALRVAGEVLASEQYAPVVRYMEKTFGIRHDQSTFFVPHWKHDMKRPRVGQRVGHTNAFDDLLNRMIFNEQKFDVAVDVARAAFNARFNLHDQFVTRS